MIRPSIEMQRAAFDLEARDLNDERRVSLSFSSETPVLVDFLPGRGGPGFEVLGHDDGEVDLSGLEPGRAPLLLDHRRDLEHQIGVIERVEIAGGRGRAVVRFARTVRADEVLARVRDEEVTQVSVGYQPLAFEDRGELDGMPLVRVTRWQPREISLVAIAADKTVGVGRSARGGRASQSQTEENQMPDTNTTAPTNGRSTGATGANAAIRAERERVTEIGAMAREFGLPADMTEGWVSDGTSLEAARQRTLAWLRESGGESMNARATMQALGAPALHGNGERRYSILAAARAQIDGDWTNAGFEREVSQEMRKRMGSAPRGVYVPTAALAGRALVTTSSQSALIGTDHMAGAFIDRLRPQSVVLASGAQSLDGLIENVSIPRLSAGATAEWVAEGSAPTESDPQLDNVTLTPRQLSASTRLSRRQSKQSLPGFETMIENDIRAQFATALDRAAIAGAGGLEPVGILDAASGVQIGQVADAGGRVAWEDLTALMAQVQEADLPMTAPGFVSTWRVRGRLLSARRFVIGTDPAGPAILQEPAAPIGPNSPAESIGGFPARFSTLVPGDLGAGSDRHALIFGDWSQLMIATWAAMDLIVDEYSEAAAGNIRIAAHLFADIGIRHATAFGALDNIDPALTDAA